MLVVVYITYRHMCVLLFSLSLGRHSLFLGTKWVFLFGFLISSNDSLKGQVLCFECLISIMKSCYVYNNNNRNYMYFNLLTVQLSLKPTV